LHQTLALVTLDQQILLYSLGEMSMQSLPMTPLPKFPLTIAFNAAGDRLALFSAQSQLLSLHLIGPSRPGLLQALLSRLRGDLPQQFPIAQRLNASSFARVTLQWAEDEKLIVISIGKTQVIRVML